MQLTDGAARLAAMRDSLLTKEKMFFVFFFLGFPLHIESFFFPCLLFFVLIFSGEEEWREKCLSFLAFHLWMRTLVTNLFYFLPQECIRVMALESK